MRIKSIREEASDETIDKWRIAVLTADQLRELSGRVSDLLSQMENAQTSGRKYLIRFAAAPKGPDPFFVA